VALGVVLCALLSPDCSRDEAVVETGAGGAGGAPGTGTTSTRTTSSTATHTDTTWTCQGDCFQDCFDGGITCSSEDPALVFEANIVLAGDSCAPECCHCFGTLCETSVYACSDPEQVCAYDAPPEDDPWYSEAVCVPLATACGGPDHLECDSDLYCELVGSFESASGMTTNCEYAAGGGYGRCLPKPIDCATEPPYPICGCDGVTYASDCERRLAGAVVAAEGACFGG
jgi:hypothetical protein